MEYRKITICSYGNIGPGLGHAHTCVGIKLVHVILFSIIILDHQQIYINNKNIYADIGFHLKRPTDLTKMNYIDIDCTIAGSVNVRIN